MAIAQIYQFASRLLRFLLVMDEAKAIVSDERDSGEDCLRERLETNFVELRP